MVVRQRCRELIPHEAFPWDALSFEIHFDRYPLFLFTTDIACSCKFLNFTQIFCFYFLLLFVLEFLLLLMIQPLFLFTNWLCFFLFLFSGGRMIQPFFFLCYVLNQSDKVVLLATDSNSILWFITWYLPWFFFFDLCFLISDFANFFFIILICRGLISCC